MSSPAKPVITFPLDRVNFIPAFTIQVSADHPDPGVNFNGFLLRRRQVSSTLGAYEYFNNGTLAWQAGTITNTVTAFAPLTTLSIGGYGFTSGVRYQMDVQLRDTAAVMSPVSDAVIAVPVAAGTPVITQPAGAITASRPKIAWVFTPGATGAKQVYWRVLIHEDTVGNIYWDSVYRYDPSRISIISEKDLRTGHNYYFGLIIVDENGMEVGNSPASAGPYTCTLNLPAAPAVTITPEPALGTMFIDATSAFNLLSIDTADMITGIGDWQDIKNADGTWDTTVAYLGTGSMRITAAGASYAYIDANSTDYADEDADYATYATEIATMEP